MPRSSVFRPLAWCLLAVVACSSPDAGCGGDGCMGEIPGGFPTSERKTNAISAKLSANGLRFFEQRANDIVGAVLGEGLSLDLECMDLSQSVPLLGTIPVFACDVNRDWRCTAADALPANRPNRRCGVDVDIRALRILPSQVTHENDDAVQVSVRLDVGVRTGNIPVRADLGLCDLSCDISYITNRNQPAHSQFLVLPIEVILHLSKDFGDVMGIKIEPIDLDAIFRASDLRINESGGFCSTIGCGALNLDFVKNFIFGFVRDMLEDELWNAIDGFRCQTCDANFNCPSGSTCDRDNGVCYSNRSQRTCPPMKPGIEGRLAAGDMVASFGGPADAYLDLYTMAGGREANGKPSLKVEPPVGNEFERGIVLGLMGGSRPVRLRSDGEFVAPGFADCVPRRDPPPHLPIRSVNFDAEAENVKAEGKDISDYQVGVAVSDAFLDKTLFDAYAAGLLCLNVDAQTTDFLSSGLFRTFLPSLGLLTQGRDVPMMIAVRPHNPPNIVVGKGTVNIEEDPLLTVVLDGMQLDFYALIDERMARLFSLTTDVRLPLSLEFNPDNTVRPVLGGLGAALQNVRASNSEMLAEDPQVVADLIDVMVGLLEPMMAELLAPIELPDLMGFRLIVQDARGLLKIPAMPGYEHLGLFAKLELDSPGVAFVNSVGVSARLVDGVIPSREEILSVERPRPYAIIEAHGMGAMPNDFAGFEYSYRVDGGLWTPWTRQSRIEVHSPVLLIQGRHGIEVRAREAGRQETVSYETSFVPFMVDYEAPTVRLEFDPGTRTVRTVGWDAVSRPGELLYRYRVGGGAWSGEGPARDFHLDELGTHPSLEVEVIDLVGLRASTYFGTPGDQVDGLGASSRSARVAEAGGCTQLGASAFALLGLVALIRRRRSSR